MTLSELAPETGSDDIVNIDDDIESLKKRFIAPIDAIRSKARPAINQPGNKKNTGTESIKNDFKDLQIDNIRPLESRAHAFYRMLGLPVVGSENSFYNPGFDPFGGKTSEKRQGVNTNFVNNFKPLVNLISFRETNVQTQRKIFARQDLDASKIAADYPEEESADDSMHLQAALYIRSVARAVLAAVNQEMSDEAIDSIVAAIPPST